MQDRIKIHSFDLGSSAPRISNARIDGEGTAGTVSVRLSKFFGFSVLSARSEYRVRLALY
jgi:hypothetical protein